MKIIAETTAGSYRIVTYELKGKFFTKVTVNERLEEELTYTTLAEAVQGHEDIAHKYIFINKENEEFFDRW